MPAEHCTLITSLLDPARYRHPCLQVELVETHISWVLLTGLRVYKIKKPVNFGFVDFTTLNRRKHFCEEELRLNRRLAPDLYLDVVAITGTVEQPQIGGEGTIIEYAVCMRQFDQRQLLSKLPLESIPLHIIDGLADQCARLHSEAECAEADSRYGSPDQIMQPVRENFNVLRNMDDSIVSSVSELENCAELQFARLRQTFDDRKSKRMIRECHGDLHLGNMFLTNDQVTVFDGVEFNDDYRWIDIVNDIAFLVMDLEDRGFSNLANRFLNRWLERTGDYTGLKVLSFYFAYRAVIRAKVDAIRMHQPSLSFSNQRLLANDCCGYLKLAKSSTRNRPLSLTITMGPSGSGKTTASQRLIEASNVIRVRSDVERKRLFGLSMEESSSGELKTRMYSEEGSAATYDRLAELSEEIIQAGFPVVVDAAFLKQNERQRFAQLADKLNVRFMILECAAPADTLRDRIVQRQQQGDASEADHNVLKTQLTTIEPLDTTEQDFRFEPTTDHPQSGHPKSG